MRKTALFLLTCLVALNIATAQTPKEQKIERIKALKVAYITSQLNLDADQAKKFWPVYNKLEQEKRQLRKSFVNKYKNDNPTATPQTARDYIDANLEYQEQELELKKKYKDELLKTITAEQLVKLYQSEKGFRQMLLKELCNRPPGNSKTP
jgi:hypothetical protein